MRSQSNKGDGAKSGRNEKDGEEERRRGGHRSGDKNQMFYLRLLQLENRYCLLFVGLKATLVVFVVA